MFLLPNNKKTNKYGASRLLCYDIIVFTYFNTCIYNVYKYFKYLTNCNNKVDKFKLFAFSLFAFCLFESLFLH